MTETDELLGLVVGGRWTLRRRIGAGGMGTVYQADDAAGGPPVAVKLVKRELLDDGDARARFEREAAALRGLDHPNIVRFLDTGETGELRWIAMEQLQGHSLKTRLTTSGAIPWRETLPVLRGVVCALEAAHNAGLIHRDLKPENIFLVDAARGGEPPIVKLLDFGVARHTQLPPGQTMTATGVVVGTPGFVAPEVVLTGNSNDARSDFYGLGATWFEMLTGERPFSAETPFALAMLHVSQPVPRPRTLRPSLDLPGQLEALLLSLLAKTPEARPPSASVLLRELDAIEALAANASAPTLASTGWRVGAPPTPDGATPPTGAGRAALGATLPGTRPTDQRLVALAALATTIGIAGVLVALLGGGGAPNDPPAPAPPSPPPMPSVPAPPPPSCEGVQVGDRCLALDEIEQQIIRLTDFVELRDGGVRGKGYARVNGGSAMYFWGSSTPPTLVLRFAAEAMPESCRAQLAAPSYPIEIVGKGAFEASGTAPRFIGTFTLTEILECRAGAAREQAR